MVTTVIVGLNVLVFLVELYILLSGGERALNVFSLVFGVVPAAIISGESILIPFYLTPLTHMFVHGGLAHLAFNMLYLSAVGDNVEDRLGHRLYLVFYLLSGLLAAFAHILVNPSSPVPSVGASGAIAGVLAGYIVLFPRGKIRILVFLGLLFPVARISALLLIGIWFAMQFFNGVASLGVQSAEAGGIAYWAHIGGFVAGLVLALVYKLTLARPAVTRII